MASFTIIDAGYAWIIERIRSGQYVDLNKDLKSYIVEVYGDLVDSIYGKLSDDFISLTVEKIIRCVKESEVKNA